MLVVSGKTQARIDQLNQAVGCVLVEALADMARVKSQALARFQRRAKILRMEDDSALIRVDEINLKN